MAFGGQYSPLREGDADSYQRDVGFTVNPSLFFCFLAGLGIKIQALHMLGKHSTATLYHQPLKVPPF